MTGFTLKRMIYYDIKELKQNIISLGYKFSVTSSPNGSRSQRLNWLFVQVRWLMLPKLHLGTGDLLE